LDSLVFRAKLVECLGVSLTVCSIQTSIDVGDVKEEKERNFRIHK